MIDIILLHGSEHVLVRIKGNSVLFGKKVSIHKAELASIDGLKLSYKGVVKEHPDLKDDDDWELKAKKRFKKHISKLSDESRIADYIIQDLRSHGYQPLQIQQSGMRNKKL